MIARNIVAVLVGWLTMVIMGLLLYPLMKELINEAVSVDIREGIVVNKLKLHSLFYLWVTISCFCAGFMTCWIAEGRKLLVVVISGFILATGLNLYNLVQLRSISTALDFLAIIPLMLMGGLTRRLIENKMED